VNNTVGGKLGKFYRYGSPCLREARIYKPEAVKKVPEAGKQEFTAVAPVCGRSLEEGEVPKYLRTYIA
jgi:hypothetical protein